MNMAVGPHSGATSFAGMSPLNTPDALKGPVYCSQICAVIPLRVRTATIDSAASEFVESDPFDVHVKTPVAVTDEPVINMLRTFKPTSPMSVGSWLLGLYGPLAAVALSSDVLGVAPRTGRAASVGAGALGTLVASYTGALIANTPPCYASTSIG